MGVFTATSTFTLQTYEDAKMSNSLDDFQNDFYAPFSEDNILVIESVKDLGETDDSTEAVSEFFQEVSGYIKFNIIKMKSQEKYRLYITFKAINEIRIMN